MVLRSELYQLLSVEASIVLPERSGRYVGRHAQMIARPFSIVAQARSPPVLTRSGVSRDGKVGWGDGHTVFGACSVDDCDSYYTGDQDTLLVS